MLITNSSRVIKGTTQYIYINGKQSNEIKCMSCNNASAQFIIPKEYFDSKKKLNLHGKQVAVKVNNKYIFNGFINTSNAQIAPDSDGFSFSAESCINKLAKIFVGQSKNKNTVRIRIKDIKLIDVLRELFNDLPDDYAGLFSLGNTSVISKNQLEYGDEYVLSNASYQDALDIIISDLGNVSYYPRFTSWGCFIDFVRVDDKTNPVVTARLAKFGEDSIKATIQNLQEDINSIETVDSVCVFGTPERFIISLKNDYLDNKSLIPGWDASLEAHVLTYPDCGKQGSPAYIPGAEFVFKRYYLPDYFRTGYTFLDFLPIEKDDGNYYNLQCMQIKSEFAYESEGVLYYQDKSQPELIDCKFDLNNGFIILNEPALNVTDVTIVPDFHNADKNTKIVNMAEANIIITVAFENDDYPVVFKTPVNKTYHNTMTINQEDYTKVSYNNINNPLHNSVVFDYVAIFFEDIFPMVLTTTTTQITIKDDTKKCRNLAYELLKENRYPTKDISFNVPYITDYFKIGHNLKISGNDTYNGDIFLITNINYDLENYQMSVEATNNKAKPFTETVI